MFSQSELQQLDALLNSNDPQAPQKIESIIQQTLAQGGNPQQAEQPLPADHSVRPGYNNNNNTNQQNDMNYYLKMYDSLENQDVNDIPIQPQQPNPQPNDIPPDMPVQSPQDDGGLDIDQINQILSQMDSSSNSNTSDEELKNYASDEQQYQQFKNILNSL